ncbi:glycosyltransferase family 8 protein [bacterium]|nr:glycosyltransferase family 8 protein [bacterium]
MKIPVFLSTDNNYAPYTASAIASISENTESKVDFYILDSGISEINTEKIKQLPLKYKHTNVEFLKIDTEKEFQNFRVPSYSLHITLSTYNRFLIPQLKPCLKKIIYLDSDIIVTGDIKELFDTDLKSYPLGAVPGQNEKFGIACAQYLGLNKKKIFNAGVLLINLEKFKEYQDKLFEIERKYRDKLVFADQDILNMCFDNNYLELDRKFNYESETTNQCYDFIIRHYITGIKPWLISPDLESDVINDIGIFWEYLSKTPFYEEVLENCPNKTKESMHKIRLERLLQKLVSENPEKFIYNKIKQRGI